MRIRIEGEASVKVQVFPSRFGWLHRMFFFREKRGFAVSQDIPNTGLQKQFSVPGPLDVFVSARIDGTTLDVDYALGADSGSFMLYQGEILQDLKASRTFKVKVAGNEVRGTVTLEA